jgi:NitT/TauT family transport system permease protein
MKPLAPISPTARVALGILFFVLFVAAWSFATLGGYVSKTFLADPLTMVEEGYDLLTKHGFLRDIGITIWRVLGGFTLAALVAVPLGITMGAYKPIEAFLEPFVSFARYLAGIRFHSAAYPVGGARRTAEASRHLHRLGIPARADGGCRGRRACAAIWSRRR